MNEFITAEHIFNVLDQHHKILKELKPSDRSLEDKVYDNVIVISSDEDEPNQKTNQVKNTGNLVDHKKKLELESIEESMCHDQDQSERMNITRNPPTPKNRENVFFKGPMADDTESGKDVVNLKPK